MALTAGGALLLAATHGLAWWYGTTAGSEVRDEHRTSNAEHRILNEQRALLDLLQQRREERKAEETRKQEEWARKRIEAERSDPRDFWRKNLAAGRAKLEAAGATDAELQAILEKVAALGDNGGNIEAEDVAALELWLERDAVAALTWLSRRAGYPGYNAHVNLAQGLVRWLGAGDCKDLPALLDRYPGAAKPLVYAATQVAEERGADFTLALAATLEDSGERYDMLQKVVYGKDRKPEHLARVLGLQAGHYTYDIFSFAANSSFGSTFGEELRKAGLPEELIAKYEANYAKPRAELRGRAEALSESESEAGSSGSPPAAEVVAADLADATGENSSWHSNAEYLAKVLPDFKTWCQEVEDRRMSPQELLAKAKATWPAAGEHEAGLRTMIFRQIFNSDPLGTMQWWQESGQQGLPAGMDDGFGDLTPEQTVGLLEKYPHFLKEGGEEVRSPFLGNFEEWLVNDPEGYDKALARLRKSAPAVADVMIALREGREK